MREVITPEERVILEDMVALIEVGLGERKVHGQTLDMSYMQIITTIAHDVMGIVREDLCFLPRSSGYSRYKRED